MTIDRKDINPLNVRLPPPANEWVRGLIPVSKSNAFISSTKDFDPAGLFSTDIFGPVGTPERLTNLSYIDLKVPYINQTLFAELTKASTLHAGILSGKKYAIYDQKTNMFVEEARGLGETGYEFFISHLDTLVIEDTGSVTRKVLTRLKDIYKESLTMSYLMIVPAGIREYTIDQSGKPSEDEINKIYRKVLAGVSLTPDGKAGTDKAVDTNRYNVQIAIQEVYKYISEIIFGKKKFANIRYVARNIHGGTKNVITGMQVTETNLDSPAIVTPNHTFVGLFQLMKASIPLTTYGLSTGMLSRIIPGDDTPMQMIDKKTLKSVAVDFDFTIYKSWFTNEGVNKIVNAYRDPSNRDVTMEYKGHYYALLYKDSTQTIVLHDIDELPNDLDINKVNPITLTELLYLSVFKIFQNRPCTVTRYPILGMGGIYPSLVYVKPTIDTEIINSEDEQYISYPIVESGYFNSLSVHTSHIVKLGADYDGDKCSLSVLQTDEAIAEVRLYLTTMAAYRSPTGEVLYTCFNGSNELVLSHITGDPE